MTEEHRVRGVVREVLREALRVRGLQGLILGAPPSPEGHLLARWCQDAVPLAHPEPRVVAALEAALPGAPDEAWMAAARVGGSREGLLPVHPANKLQLLLGPVPPAPCYPLGDLWPGVLRGWTGRATLPAVLAALPGDAAEDVERRLRQGLDEGAGVSRAFMGADPALSDAVLAALYAGRAASRPPMVPKLGAWTVGVDPAP